MHRKNEFALRVIGDSMEPEFQEGDVIFVNPQAEVKPGDFVIVSNGDHEPVTLKQLKENGEIIVLRSLHPDYPDIELKIEYNYEIAGKVVKKEKGY